MKNPGVFDKTLQKTGRWIDAVAHRMGSTDTERSYHILKAVLHALRDRLPPDEAVQLAAQLPMLVRGFYFEGWHPANKPLKYRHKQDMLDRIAADVPSLDPTQRERAATAVFAVLTDELQSGELDQVRHAMPAEIRELWPAEAATA